MMRTSSSVVLLLLIGCTESTPVVVPEPEGAQSVVIALRSDDGKHIFHAASLPLQVALPSVAADSEGLLMYFEHSLGVLRLDEGPLQVDANGIELRRIGEELDDQPALFRFFLDRDDFSELMEVPDWAATNMVRPRDLSLLCPRVLVGEALNVEPGTYGVPADLGDGAIAIVGRNATTSYVYRVDGDGDPYPQADHLGSVPGDFGALAIVDDRLALLGAESPFESPTATGTIVLADLEDIRAGVGLSDLQYESISMPVEHRGVHALFPSPAGLEGARAICGMGDVYSRSAAGEWTRVAEVEAIPRSTDCPQPAPEGATRFASTWRAPDADYLAVNTGSGPGTRPQILRVRGDEITNDCFEPSLAESIERDISIKVTGRHESGFMVHRILDRYRASRIDGVWRVDGRFEIDEDMTNLVNFDFGPDAPPGFLITTSAGSLMFGFQGGPTCAPEALFIDRIDWLWSPDGNRFLFGALDAIPRWATLVR